MEYIKKHYSTAIYAFGGLLALIIISKIGQMATADSKQAELALGDSCAALGVSFVMPLLWIVGILSIGFSLYKIIRNKEALIRFGIGIALLLLIWGIAYSSSTTDVSTLDTSVSFTSGELQFVGGLVKTLFILMTAGVVLAIASEIKKALKNG